MSKKLNHSYTCFQCGKTYKYKMHYTRHMKVHRVSDEPLVKCELNTEGWEFEGSLAQCIKTESSVDQPNALHVKPEPSNDRHCNICGKVYSSCDKVKKKMPVSDRKDENTLNSFMCKNCIEPSTSDEAKRCSCSDCGSVFTLRNNLLRHIKTHHGNQERKRFSCSYCAKTFSRKDSMVEHEKQHEGNRHNCGVCGRSVGTKYALKKHMRIHTGEMPYQCANCGKLFRHRDSRDRHSHECKLKFPVTSGVSVVQGDLKPAAQQSSHTADLLNSSVPATDENSNSQLTENHQTSTQSIVAGISAEVKAGGDSSSAIKIEKVVSLSHLYKYKCEECGKGFTWRSCFSRHMRSHKGIKQFSCTDCGKSFVRKQHLNAHKRMHSTERSFECGECEKLFRHPWSLVMHFRSKHSSNSLGNTKSVVTHPVYIRQSHPCEYCGKILASKRNLENHKALHTGEKQYSCNICGKKYSSKCALVFHSKDHKKK